nr:hypothetical protein [Rhizobium mesoamericanum]
MLKSPTMRPSASPAPHNHGRRIIAHVCDPAGQVHPHAGPWSDHAASTARISRIRVALSTAPSKRRLRPQINRNSIIPDGSWRSPQTSVCTTFMSTGTIQLTTPGIDLLPRNIVSLRNISNRRSVDPNRHDNLELLFVAPTAPTFLPKNLDTHHIPRPRHVANYVAKHVS